MTAPIGSVSRIANAWAKGGLNMAAPMGLKSIRPVRSTLVEPNLTPAPKRVSFEDLKRADDRTTDAIIALFGGDERFEYASAVSTRLTQERDALDADKLSKGIAHSVSRGVLEKYPPVEPVSKINVTGKTADQVADEIITLCGPDDASAGRVIVITGLSGTGKGSTTAKLAAKLPRSMTWSNGNLFRCLTALAVAANGSDGVPLDTLNELNVASWMKCISFVRNPTTAAYDLLVNGYGLSFYCSEAANTLLKAPPVAKALPFVAEVTQGDVIQAAGAALEMLRRDGYNVLVEGRAQTLDYIRSPFRFELVLEDAAVIGRRQVALRCMGSARDKSVYFTIVTKLSSCLWWTRWFSCFISSSFCLVSRVYLCMRV